MDVLATCERALRLESALVTYDQAAPNAEVVDVVRAVQISALLHDIDDRKFTEPCDLGMHVTYPNARKILSALYPAHENGGGDITNLVLWAISQVSTQENGNSWPSEENVSALIATLSPRFQQLSVVHPRWVGILLVVRLADRAAALGNIGVARCLMYSAETGVPVTDEVSDMITTPQELQKSCDEGLVRYQLGGGRSTCMVMHFPDKLLPIADPGPAPPHLAGEAIAFMLNVLSESGHPLSDVVLSDPAGRRRILLKALHENFEPELHEFCTTYIDANGAVSGSDAADRYCVLAATRGFTKPLIKAARAPDQGRLSRIAEWREAGRAHSRVVELCESMLLSDE